MPINIGGGISIGGGVIIRDEQLTIGAPYGGGFYAGQISTTGNGVATHNLVYGPRSSTLGVTRWSTSNSTIPNVASDINGPGNTANAVAWLGSNAQAANYCDQRTTGGYTDWYLPAKNELEVLFYNLKPTTASNNTNSGANPNAVPARASNYTALGAPTQTPATQFQYPGGPDCLVPSAYWSSTQSTVVSFYYAWQQVMGAGTQRANGGGYLKTSFAYAQAIRRVAV